MEINAVVSENARRLREEKRLTLDEAARLTGVSRSMLAQIEKGDVNPTISMVWKIANGYKVSFTSLVEPARERPVLLRVLSAQELGRLKAIVREADEDAFLFISDAHEVLGEGFRKLME